MRTAPLIIINLSYGHDVFGFARFGSCAAVKQDAHILHCIQGHYTAVFTKRDRSPLLLFALIFSLHLRVQTGPLIIFNFLYIHFYISSLEFLRVK
jgi:hypothetical protein